MIKEKNLEINISYRNITHYKKLGYNAKLHETISIVPKDLTDVSHQKITAVCDKCGQEKIISYHKYLVNEKRCGYYGCKSCANLKREITSLNRFGVTNYAKTDECKDKITKNNVKKYGVKTTLLEKNTKEKIDKTIFDKYGVNEILSSIDVRKKIIITNLEKWGVDHYSKTIDFYNNTYNRWKSDALFKLSNYNIIDFILKDDRTIDIKCDQGCDHYFNINSKNLYQRKNIQKTILCTVCNTLDYKESAREIEIANFIELNYDNVIKRNDNDTISKELDIYLPDINLAFEYNGIYWHSDIYKEINYHINKTEECELKGIQLIHIWEDEWINKQDIVKSMIINKLNKNINKIYARKCEIKEIDNNDLVKNFLNKNHIQGYVGAKIKIGLFYNDDLVSFMSFGKYRRNLGNKISSDNNYELLRFCNKLNTSVVGGASRLFNYFIKKYNPNEIVSYADRSWSKGNLYFNLGFYFEKKTVPNYFYFDNNLNRYNRFNFRKDQLIKKGYDKNKSEHEIMSELGYLCVYNSGNLKFLYKHINNSFI
jgi:hypothetical protein